MIVVSDTSPLNYLILIGADEVLPRLFPDVLTTVAVLRELQDPAALLRLDRERRGLE